MQVNLMEMKKEDIISLSELLSNSKQRILDGISDVDVTNFSDFIDTIVYIGLLKIKNSENIHIPTTHEKSEWLKFIDRLLNLSENIYNNNLKMYNTNCNEFATLKELETFIDALKADSYATRKKLYKFLCEYWDEIYAY